MIYFYCTDRYKNYKSRSVVNRRILTFASFLGEDNRINVGIAVRHPKKDRFVKKMGKKIAEQRAYKATKKPTKIVSLKSSKGKELDFKIVFPRLKTDKSWKTTEFSKIPQQLIDTWEKILEKRNLISSEQSDERSSTDKDS